MICCSSLLWKDNAKKSTIFNTLVPDDREYVGGKGSWCVSTGTSYETVTWISVSLWVQRQVGGVMPVLEVKLTKHDGWLWSGRRATILFFHLYRWIDGGTFYKIGEEISWGRVSQEWHLISNTFSWTYLGDILMAISSRQLERQVWVQAVNTTQRFWAYWRWLKPQNWVTSPRGKWRLRGGSRFQH